MVSKSGSKDVAWQQLVEDVMPSMGRTPELEWRQKDEDSTDRVVVNLPRSVVDLVDLYVGRRGMRGGKRRGIRRFRKFDEGTGQRGLFEHPELTAGRSIVLPARLDLLEVLGAIAQRDDRSLHAQGARHAMLSAEGQGSETGVGNLLERALQVTHEAVGVGTIDDLVIE